MLVLSALVVLMSLLASWNNEKHGAVYIALVLFLEAGLFGTFTALNFFHWFIFWELSLIPAFFLVRIWGGKGRAKAANQFFLYTMVGSVALLLAFLALFLATGRFDFVDLAQLAQSGQLTTALAQNLHWSGNPEHLGDAALLGGVSGIRGEGAGGAVPHLAAGGVRGSAERDDDAADGRDVEDGRVWFPADSAADFSGADAARRNAAAVAGGGDDRAAGVCGVGAEGSEADVRLFVDQPPGLLRAGRLRGGEVHRRGCGAGGAKKPRR